jgi:DNA-binding HxlR family transcriptional regulator
VEVRATADLLERRWQLSISTPRSPVRCASASSLNAVAGISPRMLSERLRDLERRRSRRAQRHSLLTTKGRRLAPIIEAMREYART